MHCIDMMAFVTVTVRFDGLIANSKLRSSRYICPVAVTAACCHPRHTACLVPIAIMGLPRAPQNRNWAQITSCNYFPPWTFNYNLIFPCLFYLPPSVWLLVTLSTDDYLHGFVNNNRQSFVPPL